MTDAASFRNISINGRFLTQKLSGVQRYGREIVSALDRLIASDRADGASQLGHRRWRLLVPPGADESYALDAIEIEHVGKNGGHRWEQVDLAWASRGERLINLGNSGPVLHFDKSVVIHDAAVFRTPGNFGRRYRLVHQMLGRTMALSARLGTVSHFSRGELSSVLGVPLDRIFVAGNGCDHLIGRGRNDRILAELGLEAGRYFLVVGTNAPNKNVAMALAAFARLGRPGIKLVLAGSMNNKVFGGAQPDSDGQVIVASGRSDEEVAALLASAAALLFCSRYEGFGIPPLEAMVQDCPVIACDIPVVREVCGDAISYVPLDDVDALAQDMRRHLDDREGSGARRDAARQRIERYSWDRAAFELAGHILAA